MGGNNAVLVPKPGGDHDGGRSSLSPDAATMAGAEGAGAAMTSRSGASVSSWTVLTDRDLRIVRIDQADRSFEACAAEIFEHSAT